MPKKTKPEKKSGLAKGVLKKGRGRRGGNSDDESLCDTASILSVNSDRGSFEDGENGNTADEYNDGRDVEIYGETQEDKIGQAVDDLTEKSVYVRRAAFNTLSNTLKACFKPELLLDRHETLRDNLERILKRGQSEDQCFAAKTYSLSLLQIGGVDNELAAKDFCLIKETLQARLLDHTTPMSVRVQCCESLCLGSFLVETCLQDVVKLLELLEPLFGCKSDKRLNVEYKPEKKDAFGIGAATPTNNVKQEKTPGSSLAAAAIHGWTLLLTVLSQDYLSSKAFRWTSNIQGLLDHSDLELRLKAGEALAVLVELCALNSDSTDEGTDGEEEYAVNTSSDNGNMRQLINRLKELSVESHKYRAKKDRRQQHHSFRDFLHAVEDNEGPNVSMKFGNGEVLEIDSWSQKRQYDAIAKVLGSGINRHLTENPLVRGVMGLGTPRPQSNPVQDSRQAKNERHYMNAQNFKVRSVNRGKNRDLRMAMFQDY